MNTLTKTLAVAALAAFASPFVTPAAEPTSATQNVPGTMNYQGYLADPSSGNPYVDGIYTLDIRIWDSPAGTSASGCLWGGRYSVYVKDGYFNLMLGDPNATPLPASDGVSPKYANAELWKALWGASATDTDRYLGVTPRENAAHAPITSPTEIAPRQQLLSSPFAFRAQHAQYADQSLSDFTVPGNLTVNGTINATATGSQKFGPIATTSSSVQLGGGTSATTSQPSIYNVGKYLYLKSYYDMTFAPTAGNMTFTTPSASYKMQVTGSGEFKSDTPKNTIGGTGATVIQGGTTTVKGSTSTTIGASGATTTINGSSVTLAPTSGRAITLMPGADGLIKGEGEFLWGSYSDGLSGGTFKPFAMKTVTVSLSSYHSTSGSVKIADDSNRDWTVVSVLSTSSTPPKSWYVTKSGTTFTAHLKIQSSNDATYYTYTLYCLGIHKDFADGTWH